MSHKGKAKVLPEAPSLDAPPPSTAPASSMPASKDKGKAPVDDSNNVSLTDAPASELGISQEEKLRSLRTIIPDSGFIEGDSDEELKVEVKTEAFHRVRYTVILLLPVTLALEVASVITTVQTLLRRVYRVAASLPASPLITPIRLDPAIVLISTEGNRKEWICTQVGCGKAKRKSFMTAANHITSANHLIHLE
ncbi:unnamed protein product [Closterium sp. NIES-65]|nr:unnamed protein product [Closterium sp. NIES-65]